MIIVTATLYQIYYFGHRKKNMIFFDGHAPKKLHQQALSRIWQVPVRVLDHLIPASCAQLIKNERGQSFHF